MIADRNSDTYYLGDNREYGYHRPKINPAKNENLKSTKDNTCVTDLVVVKKLEISETVV